MRKKFHENLIIEKGNIVFNGLLICVLIFSWLLCNYLMSTTMEEVKKSLIYLNIASLLLMIPYRILLVTDKKYHAMVYGDLEKPYLFELPFYPCNTAELLFIVAIITRNQPLLAYCFFLSLIGTIMAFVTPPKGFEKGSLLDFRIFAFYMTHYFNFINIPIMLVTHFYIPGHIDVLFALGIYLLLALIFHQLNKYIDSLNLGKIANYFFTNDPDYHLVFKKCYSICPYKYFFILPVVILGGIILEIFVIMIHMIL